MYVTLTRTLIVYIVIVISLRIMGKRQLGELQPSELVVTILISNLATLPVEDTNVPLLAGVLPILLLVSFEVVISAMGLRFRWVRQLVSGNPIVVIKDGVIDQCQMENLRFSVDDLMAELRADGIFDIRDVDYAIVETTGKLSAYQKFAARPATAQMLGLSQDDYDAAPPALIITDGVLLPEGLAFCNLRREWLDDVLARQGYGIENIFLMTCNRSADYFLVPKERGR